MSECFVLSEKSVFPCRLTQSQSISLNPLYVMIPCTLSASFAFMLPVATPPNAIVFSYGILKVTDMVSSASVRTRLFRTIRGSLNDLLRLLHCAPCRLKPAWWWTSSGSAASVWPSTAGVASCSAWTLSLHGPTPPHRCRNNNLLPHLHLQASSLKSTLRFWVEFVFVFCCFWATRNIHLMFGPPHYWCRECFTVFLSDSGATKGSVDCCSLRSTANSLTECCLVLFWFTVSSNWTPHRGFFDCLRVISLTQQCHRYC